MKVVVAGASGLIGVPLVRRLRAQGHEVVRLVRRAPTAPGEVRWDPATGVLDPVAVAGADAAVDLAGAGIGDRRWTRRYRRTVLHSRTSSTGTLARALAAQDRPPAVLLQASATGYYGDRGEEELTEASAPGTGFVPGVCMAWEAAAEPARAAGIRVVALRTGLVLTPEGGLVGRMAPLLRTGLAGPLGSGRAWWSWITLEDQLRALLFLLEHDVAGPVNLVAPEPARNGDLVRALARGYSRPALLPVPALALRAAVGGFAEEILASRRVLPQVLAGAGFRFTAPDLAGAVRQVTAA
ncbi:TIGR01777 family oxidoreductase [Quadrisphaera sp. DSM 44207]|uniref:TIGR01777 family oxidoreductase n=1 Tax=Quadrisphaera sp. DSM 44207 TaxID=1881057 RepID=UPI000880A93A|nr:TIGR01777 family oxidoreductase [Quadrisphaera sp. DSM 44207]SDQ32654.1 hypothetical protein SAMN05428996_1241 [Quadrisphaera sp. DSM 44207]